MPDSRVEKVREKWFANGWAEGFQGEEATERAASRMVTEMEQADLGVFDPEDEILAHELAMWLQRRVCDVLSQERATSRAAELLAWLREAGKQ